MFVCLLAFFVSGIFDFNGNGGIQRIGVKNAEAEELLCEGPADVVLVIDRSATMNNYGKFDIAKTASVNFIDNLFSTSPDGIYSPNDYHQIGLVAFNNLVDSEALNRNDGDYMQNIINQSDGILGSAYPIGYRRTSLAIGRAKDLLDPIFSSVNPSPSATKTMIVLTDGAPYYDIELAKANADSAKEDKGIRIISIGLKLDSILNETERIKAEEFIKYIASTPSDCYYASDSGSALVGCNSISAANLADALGEVYGGIIAAVCDENPPSILISRKPAGTLYNVDKLTITSTATDDIGFKSHSIKWSDDWPNNVRNIECGDLIGTVISCSTGELGPFATGTTISYRSAATDANDNEVIIDPPKTVTAASVALSVPVLFRNINNIISLTISDPAGSAHLNGFYITIDAPALPGTEIEKAAMTCSGTGSNRTCVYSFNPGCDWTDGITGGMANNIDANINIYAQSGDMGIRQIASSAGDLIVSYYEGDAWAGTCTDGINNNCDYDEDSDPIIDSEEMLCDAGAPIIGISRSPSGDIYDDNSVTFVSNATDSNGIKRHTIYYKMDDESFQIAFDCNDANIDSLCDEDTGQSVGNISKTFAPFPTGTKIEYYSRAVDYSGNDNESSTATEFFIVRNRECEGVADLGACLVTAAGKCCGEVCNTSAVNSGPFGAYNTDFCAELSCDGAVLKWVPNFFTGQCAESGDSDDCYSFTPDPLVSPLSPPALYDNNGCEEREYKCDNGYCNYGLGDTRRIDSCDDFGPNPLIWKDFQCESGECKKIQEWEDEKCDNTISFADLVVTDSDGKNITGKPEVLDSKTNTIKITANVADPSGIASYKIYWQLNGGLWQEKDCGSCGPSTEATMCSCVQEIGPLNYDDFLKYYMWSRDNSPNQNEEYTVLDGGLKYDYYTYSYSGTDKKGIYKGSDIDTNLVHTSWGNGRIFINGDNAWEDQIDAAMTWEGFIKPDVLGEYTISAWSDEGIKIYIDGNSVVEYWAYSTVEHLGTYTFTSLDPVPIKILWYDYTGNGAIKVGWTPPGETVSVYPIPAANLMSPYTLAVRDSECYDINFDYTLSADKDDIETLCDLDNGICCGGYCDSSPSLSLYDEECHVNSCSGMNWIYAISNVLGETKEGDSCGSADTCFDHYSLGNSFYGGCITGGSECSSGYCAVSSALTFSPVCNGNLLTNYDCDPDNATGTCQPKDSDIDCSAAGDYDSDAVACNCDCNNYDTEEKIYSSLSFDGKDDYVWVGKDMINNNMSLEFWIKPDATNITQRVIHNGNGAGWGPGPEITVLIEGGYVKVTGESFYGSGNDIYIKTPIATDWTHVVFVLDGVNVKLYKNGNKTPASTDTWAGVFIKEDPAYGVDLNDFKNFNISGRELRRFFGSLDGIRVYSRALYPEEINHHYNGIFADDTGLIGRWDFDEGDGKIVADSSGNGNDGTLNNFDGILGGEGIGTDLPAWSAGKFGSGLDFDGINDYVKTSAFSIPNASNAITFSGWINGSKKAVTQTLISDASQSSTTGFLYLYRLYNVDYLTWQFAYGTGYSSFSSSSDFFTGYDNQWVHVAVVVDYANKTGKFYRNGELINTATTTLDVLFPTANKSKYIGSYNPSLNMFDGLMDDVRVYSRALSDAEVADHYQSIFTDNSDLLGYWNFNEGSGVTAYDNAGNGPRWMKYGKGNDKDENDNIINVLNRNVPVPWQVCTDVKDNDCDVSVDDYDNGTGVSDCDGEVDIVEMVATAKDRTCAADPGCVDGSDLFGAGNTITAYDIDIERDENDFTITAGAIDDFLIQETEIEWTTDNWANKGSKICEDTGVCEVCIEGGTCGDENDLILSSSLSAGNTFSFRVCAWDNSANSNKKCTGYYNIVTSGSNLPPEITPLLVYNPNFCSGELSYILDWNFNDPDGDGQSSYEVQIKEGDNNFSDVDELVVNTEKNLPSSYYQILSTDFINDKEMEYGSKTYYWRVRVTDNRGEGYEKTSDWEEGPQFTTPIYEYPRVDFSAIPDYSIECLYETGYEHTGTEDRCDFGENITFFDESIFVNCDNSDDKQCIIANAAKCDVASGLCVACESDSSCAKFGLGYKCEGGVCNPPDGFVCLSDSDCKRADAAKCDMDTAQCAACDDDSQCPSDKFDIAGIDFFCNNGGKCEDKDHREWYFYGADVGEPDSIDLNPINNYIESVTDNYNVILKIKDITGNSCSRIKNILLGGRKYPKWNESSSSGD